MSPPPAVYKLAAEPQQLKEGLWAWDASVRRIGFPTRMIVMSYETGDGTKSLIVVSPVPPEERVVAWLKELGTVKFIVAPNLHHTWWSPALKAAFPSATLLATSGLRPKEGQDSPYDVFIDAPADLPPSWPTSSVAAVKIRGLPSLDELVFVHHPSKTLVVGDIAFNINRTTAHQHFVLPVRWYLSLAGGYRRCCVSSTFKLLVKDAAAMKASLEEVLAYDFDAVSVMHGDFIPEGGKQAFKEGTYAFVSDLASRRERGGPGAAAVGVTAMAGAVALAGIGIGVAALTRKR